MIVMKFGGSSVESAVAIERVAGIVKKRLDRHPVVVVSAMGKTTNKLLAIAAAAIDGKRDEFIRQLHDLRDYGRWSRSKGAPASTVFSMSIFRSSPSSSKAWPFWASSRRAPWTPFRAMASGSPVTWSRKPSAITGWPPCISIPET
jgi:hypothetical protein